MGLLSKNKSLDIYELCEKLKRKSGHRIKES